jgi:hypothetical protein
VAKTLPLTKLHSVKGAWNHDHTAWTTVDGRFKIVRRFSKGTTPGAWIVYVMPRHVAGEFARLSQARTCVNRLSRDLFSHPSENHESAS